MTLRRLLIALLALAALAGATTANAASWSHGPYRAPHHGHRHLTAATSHHHHKSHRLASQAQAVTHA